jgi:hypothetical protein
MTRQEMMRAAHPVLTLREKLATANRDDLVDLAVQQEGQIADLKMALQIVAAREAVNAARVVHLRGERDKVIVHDVRGLPQMLRAERIKRRLMQATVAQRMGNASSHISDFEHHAVAYQFSTVLKYIQAMGGELRLWLPDIEEETDA